MLDVDRVFVTIVVNGTTLRADRPDALGRWVVRHDVAPGLPLALDITWWNDLDRTDGAAIRLAALVTTLPAVTSDRVVGIDGSDYSSEFDDDADGMSNLEEALAGSDPLSGSDTGSAAEAGLVDVPGSRFYRSADNSTRVSGPVIGGSGPEGALMRTPPFRIEPASEGGVEEGLEILSVRLSGFTSLMVVANRTDEFHCEVGIGYSILDGEGVRNDSFEFVAGAVGRDVSDGSRNSACIAPGEYAYLLDFLGREIGPDPNVTIVGVVSVSGGRYEPEDAVVEVSSYELDGADLLRFAIVNRGPTSVRPGNVRIVFLDAAGVPVAHDTGASGTSGDALAPGAESEGVIGISFDTDVSTARFIVDVR